jgi:hypothetical protein
VSLTTRQARELSNSLQFVRPLSRLRLAGTSFANCPGGRAMGLFKLLTFPVSLPVSGGRWVLQTLLTEAERRYYDEAAIRQEMAELERQLVAGEVDDETFDRREEELLKRLLKAREYRMGQGEEQPEQ